jgi:hypothetical protein
MDPAKGSTGGMSDCGILAKIPGIFLGSGQEQLGCAKAHELNQNCPVIEVGLVFLSSTKLGTP